MQSELWLVDGHEPGELLSRLRESRDERDGAQRAIREVMRSELVVTVIEPVEPHHTVVHALRAELLHRRRHAMDELIDAPPRLLPGLVSTPRETIQVRCEIPTLRMQKAVLLGAPRIAERRLRGGVVEMEE